MTIIPFNFEQITLLKSWVDSKEVMFQWTGNAFQWPFDDSESKKYLKKINEDKALKSYSVIDNVTNNLIGHFDIDGIHVHNRRGEISRVIICPELRNKGYGKKMMKVAIDYSFNILEIHRLALKVFEFNQNAISCYENVGFVHEGILRDFVYQNNRYWNLCVMSILNKDIK